MLSRIMWIGLAGIALVVGILIQDGGGVLSWGDHRQLSHETERDIRSSVERNVGRRIAKMQIVDSDGREVDVPPELKRALATAVTDLVKAETDRAVLRVRDASAERQSAAEARRLAARAEVDRLQGEVQRTAQAAEEEQAAIRDQVRTEVREQVRQAVREAVRN